jgi:hypothetical protein
VIGAAVATGREQLGTDTVKRSTLAPATWCVAGLTVLALALR